MLKTGRDRPQTLDDDAAAGIAVQALGFIAADEALFHRFLALTGLETSELRAAAAEPGFLAGVLDFLLGHEPTLLAFAADGELEPETIIAARDRLGGAFGSVPQ